ncbi:MAG TPA: chemotaxis protein CheW [Polyangiaceae bacterium]|nr:chemotaxis protein CheW [Polyangiaceae bacterium]
MERQRPVPRSFDWQALRARLSSAQAALSGNAEASAARQREVLQSRALSLASRSDQPDATRERLSVVEFSLAHESYAVESRHVREVVALRDYTPLPGTSAFVLGVIQLHGHMLSLLDLRHFFALPSPGLTELNRVLVIQDHRLELGLLTDAVHSVREMFVDELQSAPATLSGLRASLCGGVDPAGVILLHAERLLAAQELVPYEQRA